MAFGVKKGISGKYATSWQKSSPDYEMEKFRETQSSLQREYQSAYQDILKKYQEYETRQDDKASILKAYYLELLQDLADPKRSRGVVKKWASGYVVGIGPKSSAISSKLPLPYNIKKVVGPGESRY